MNRPSKQIAGPQSYAVSSVLAGSWILSSRNRFRLAIVAMELDRAVLSVLKLASG
jgi:hypothetical protein